MLSSFHPGGTWAYSPLTSQHGAQLGHRLGISQSPPRQGSFETEPLHFAFTTHWIKWMQSTAEVFAPMQVRVQREVASHVSLKSGRRQGRVAPYRLNLHTNIHFKQWDNSGRGSSMDVQFSTAHLPCTLLLPKPGVILVWGKCGLFRPGTLVWGLGAEDLAVASPLSSWSLGEWEQLPPMTFPDCWLGMTLVSGSYRRVSPWDQRERVHGETLPGAISIWL